MGKVETGEGGEERWKDGVGGRMEAEEEGWRWRWKDGGRGR